MFNKKCSLFGIATSGPIYKYLPTKKYSIACSSQISNCLARTNPCHSLIDHLHISPSISSAGTCTYMYCAPVHRLIANTHRSLSKPCMVHEYYLIQHCNKMVHTNAIRQMIFMVHLSHVLFLT